MWKGGGCWGVLGGVFFDLYFTLLILIRVLVCGKLGCFGEYMGVWYGNATGPGVDGYWDLALGARWGYGG